MSGKGDKARNIGPKFQEHYPQINWNVEIPIDKINLRKLKKTKTKITIFYDQKNAKATGSN